MDTLRRWHELIDVGDIELLPELLDDDVTFHSPVLFRPVEGRELTTMYLTGAYQVLVAGGSFRYVREVVDGSDAVLEFVAEVDGLEVNGVDMITWNHEGRIVDFKVMVRPRKALDLVQRKMAELLAS